MPGRFTPPEGPAVRGELTQRFPFQGTLSGEGQGYLLYCSLPPGGKPDLSFLQVCGHTDITSHHPFIPDPESATDLDSNLVTRHRFFF